MTGRLVGLDLLRGVAVALVLLRHALPEAAPGAGVVGVVMFFALSGHLITGVLVADRERGGRIRLARFYRRRATRLLPALVVVLAAVVVVTLVADPLGDRAELPRTVLVALTWTANLPFDQGSDAIFHLWTLATEEQFYLLWPALLGWAPPPGAAGLSLGVLLVLAVVPLRGHALTYLLGGPAIAAATVVLIHAWRRTPPLPAVLLRPLVALGTIAYGAYLWNYPLSLWFRAWWGTGAVAGIVAAALTVALAAATWHWVERPVLARRDRREARDRALAGTRR